MQQKRHSLHRTLRNKADVRKKKVLAAIKQTSPGTLWRSFSAWPWPNLVVSSSAASFCSCQRSLVLTGTSKQCFILFVFKASPLDTAHDSPASSRAVPSVCCPAHLAQKEPQELSLLLSASGTSSARNRSTRLCFISILLSLYWEKERFEKK